MAEQILVADDDPVLRMLLATVLERHGFEVITVPSGDALVRTARDIMPDLLLIDVMMPVMDGLEAIRQLRQDTRTSHLPMLLITAQSTSQQAVQGFESGADDYITKPFNNDLLVARIRANLRRAARMPVNNPLTGMPGNMLIAEEVNYRLRNQRPFALLWIDLDNFKSFNDAYGFGRGDRVLRLLGDQLTQLKQERSNDDDFIGHIGGDDFVVVTHPESAQEISERLIERFDAVIPELYDAEDIQRGYLTGFDRYGTPRRFPLVSLSIGIVDTSRREYDSYDQVSTVAAEVKSYAKKGSGSTFAFDERQRSLPTPVGDRRGQPPLVVIAGKDQDLYQRIHQAVKRVGCREKQYDPDVTTTAILEEKPELVVLEAISAHSWELLDQLNEDPSKILPTVMVVSTPGDDERAIAAGASAAVPHDLTAGQFVTVLAGLLRIDESTLPDQPPS
jgi:diguanylate cyclase (GGDEF)-like protein